MKILFITHYDNMYGANKAMYKLIMKLKETGRHECMAVIPAAGELSKSLEKSGIRCIIHPITQWQAPYKSFLRFAVKKFVRKKHFQQEVNELYHILKDENIDVIHSNSSVIGTGAFLARRLGCQHIWHIREFSKEHFAMKYFYNLDTVRKYYESADYLIAISDSLKENYKKRYPKANVVRIYDGVDPTFEDNRISHEDICFCYVGYLYEKKHQLEVINACRYLESRGIDNYRLYIIGDGKSDYKSKLEEAIAEIGTDRIELTGYVDNVHDYLNRADVGIIASEYEGFGLVTVEYMLHGLPVIGYSSGGTAELVADGVTGLLVEEYDELGMAMQRLIENRELAMSMGEAGKKRAVGFSEEANAMAVCKIYDMINGATEASIENS